jgi:serine/threonine protein kinase
LHRESFTTVLQAVDPLLGRTVIIKRLNAAAMTHLPHFREEARMLASLEHPNLVSLLDYDESGPEPYQVLSFVEGGSAGAFLASDQRMDPRAALPLLADVARALDHIHQAGYAHYDVKPANVMIGARGNPILVDLMAAFLAPELASEGRILGTPEYMAPERWRGELTGALADIWSLGITAYELLTGQRPFTGDPATIKRLVTEQKVDLSRLPAGLPPFLNDILARCLAVEPTERYPDAASVAADLQLLLEDWQGANAGAQTVEIPQVGRRFLLHVEHTEAGTQGAYRDVEIRGVLGSGSFGQVYRAHDRVGQREMALKILKTEWVEQKDAVLRFRREAAILAAIQHPHIVRVFNYGRFGGSFFLCMEIVEGQTFGELMKERGALPWREAIDRIEPLLDALDCLHARDVVHRDIKPANIALSGDRVVLMDFGLARSVDMTDLTAAGQVVGTPRYMAPEQFRGTRASAATDLYSLGAVLFELISGQPLRQGRGLPALVAECLYDDPPSLAAVAGKVPAPVVQAVDRLLRRDPEERAASAQVRALFAAAR